MALQSSPSSSSSSLDRVKYDVFLSFRGFDTRYGFTGNLYKALKDRGIHTFIDNRELKGGEDITPTLLKAIEDSRVAIIVFSENYAQSSFCLDELVHIIECSKAKERLVLPVFYGVEPTHLRRNTGCYGEALAKHEAKFRNNKETCTHNMKRLQKWKTALEKAANLSGHHFKLDGEQYEYEFIGNIVDIVSEKINRTPLYVQDCRVGLKPRVLQVKSLLNMESDDGVCMVGIHGMAGIGKTTLAREIYNSIFNHFEASCFLDDVRKNPLLNLQETLLHQTIKEDIKLGSEKHGMSVIRQRLQTMKVLLILDNVDDLKQLVALVGRRDWFGPGSRIIITTRDLDLLNRHGIEKIYKVEELDMDEALELLSWKAFGKNKVDPSDKDILKRVFTCASGLPLALEVVGSNLFGKKIEEWEPILARYKRNPGKNIQETLSVSFDALEKDEQSVFLDIACCFNNKHLEDVELILCARYGYCIKDLIKVLVEKSLIKITDCSSVELHDLIEDMGKDIVQRESPKEPGRRSRLWSEEDIVTVLEDNTGTSNIEIICSNSVYSHSQCKVDWNGEAFKKMRNLKTLIVDVDWPNNFHFSEGPQHFPNSLRVLIWNQYPLRVIPSVSLNKRLENMTILNLNCSHFLTDTPNVSNLPNLEVFSFRFCYNLITIHESIGFLSKLKILDVRDCESLKSFPPLKKLPSLQVLELSDCVSLENFPEILGEIQNITEIDIRFTSIKELSSSFQNLTGLCNLNILGCWGGLKVPISILLMLNLSRVIIKDCQLLQIENDNITPMVSTNIKVLHLQFCKLSNEILSTVLKLVVNVEELYLDDSDFTILPECIKECCFLRKLSFEDCRYLQKIEGIPPNLKYLNAWGCKLLTSLGHSSMLLNQKLHEDGGTDFRFPVGINERIPEWFEHQSKGTSISFWFRKNVPSIALFVHGEAIYEEDGFSLGAELRINGCKYPLHLEVNYRMYSNNAYLFDVRLQDRGLESELGKALLKNEWIDAVIEFYDDDDEDRVRRSKLFIGSGTHLLFLESGIHVFKEKTNLEDIRFTDPYDGKRKFGEGWVKVNCDGVLARKSNVASCGGVLRDHWGSFLGGFAGQLGEIPILHAELKAILYGIQFAWKSGYRKVIVKSKSLSAIQLLRKECPPDLSCLNLVREINIFCSSAGEVVWSHTSREKNRAAHDLSIVALDLSWDRGLIVF